MYAGDPRVNHLNDLRFGRELTERGEDFFTYVTSCSSVCFLRPWAGDNLVSERWPTSAWHGPLQFVEVLKANSSRWLHEHGLEFAWQEGYGAFSVSSSNKAAVTDYIEHQPEHHQKRSYEGEFEAMLRKSGIAFDAKEVFG